MKRISVAVLLVGLFFAGAAVQAIHNPLDKAKKISKKLSMKDLAVKYKKYAEDYKKKAAKMAAKGNKEKAAYYNKLAEAKLKMSKAYETNNLKALKQAQAEYNKLKKGSKKAAKGSKKYKK